MKKFLLFLLGLIVLLVIGVTVFLLTFDLNSYRNMIEEKLSLALGRSVTIGRLEMKLSLIPTVKINDIQVGNPDRFVSDEKFLKINSAEATLAVAPLFSKRIEIQTIRTDHIDVSFVKHRGQGNWTFETRRENREKQVSEMTWQTRIDNITAQTISLSYQDGEQKYNVGISDFSLKQLKVFSMTVSALEQTFKITGTVDDLFKFIRKEPDYLFNVEVIGAGTTLKLSGSIGDTAHLKNLLLNIDVNSPSLKQTLAAFGVSSKLIPAQSFSTTAVIQGDLSELKLTNGDMSVGGNKLKANFDGTLSLITGEPIIDLEGKINLADWSLAQIWGIRPFTSDVTINATKEAIRIKNASLRAGRTDLQITGNLTLAQAIPTIDLSVASEYFGLQDVIHAEEQQYRAATDVRTYGHVIQNKPIDLTFLKRFNGKLALKMPHMNLTDAITGYIGVNGTLLINNGQLQSKDFKVAVLEGVAQANLVIKTAPAQSLAVSLMAQNLNLNNVKALNNILTNSKIDMELDLNAQGNDIQSLLSTLTGKVIAEIPQGTIVNKWFNNDVVETLGGRKKKTVAYSTTDQVNELLCSAMNLQIKNGLIQSKNDIALETPHVGFLIGGEVNLPAEKVNLSVRPVLYNNSSNKVDALLKAVSQFIQISGTFTQFQKGEQKVEPKLEASDVMDALSSMGKQEKPQVYQLCQQVLGRPSEAQVRKEKKKTQLLPEPQRPAQQNVQKTPEDQFKQQLLESLTQVLQ